MAIMIPEKPIDISFTGRNNRNGVEIYRTARYFIMTGDTLLYDKIIDNQEAIDYIVERYFPEMRESENTGVAPKIYTPKWEKPMIDGRVKLRPVYPLIPNGCRNICLTSLAGMLHNQGYNPQAMRNIMCRWGNSSRRRICLVVRSHRKLSSRRIPH